jgi:2-C-methyl-D-erythritol 4-phosphate cytidylyltransferase
VKRYTIIVAGGKGKRMNTTIPKQFLLLQHRPILMHTIDRFVHFDPSIHLILVLPETLHEDWKQLCIQYQFKTHHEVVKGGVTRYHSVKNGLQSIKENGIVGIHDAVRPLVSIDTIQRCFEVAEQKGNAVPVIGVTESLRKMEGTRNIAIDRSEIYIVQTPQVFKSEQLLSSYGHNFQHDFTDDASVVEKSGYAINLIEGNPENIKITNPLDLRFADVMMNSG